MSRDKRNSYNKKRRERQVSKENYNRQNRLNSRAHMDTYNEETSRQRHSRPNYYPSESDRTAQRRKGERAENFNRNSSERRRRKPVNRRQSNEQQREEIRRNNVKYNRKNNKPLKKHKRKQEKTKKIKAVSPGVRKFKRILTYSLILLFVLGVGITLSLTVFFKTENINVNGKTKYKNADIINASKVKKEDNIFLVNREESAQNIINKFPYIEEAKVSFKIPDIINISVKESKPCYIIKVGESYLLISNKGRILEKMEAEPKLNIPRLQGPSLDTIEEGKYVAFENDKVLSILEEIIETLEKSQVKDIKNIDISNLAKISLNYDNRIKINLGMPEDIDYKIRTATTIINEKLDPDNTAIIQGELDVSKCNTEKGWSTFNEKTIEVAGNTNTSEENEETTLDDTENSNTETLETEDNENSLE